MSHVHCCITVYSLDSYHALLMLETRVYVKSAFFTAATAINSQPQLGLSITCKLAVVVRYGTFLSKITIFRRKSTKILPN